MKISQVAIYVPDQQTVKHNMLQVFGPLDFYSDSLKMDGIMNDTDVVNIPLLLTFTHKLMDGVELEYISSENLFHWHHEILAENGNKPFLSHLGAYVEMEEFVSINEMMIDMNIPKLQDTETHSHSNKRSDGSERHYCDIIFDTRKHLGFNLKITTRI